MDPIKLISILLCVAVSFLITTLIVVFTHYEFKSVENASTKSTNSFVARKCDKDRTIHKVELFKLLYIPETFKDGKDNEYVFPTSYDRIESSERRFVPAKDTENDDNEDGYNLDTADDNSDENDDDGDDDRSNHSEHTKPDEEEEEVDNDNSNDDDESREFDSNDDYVYNEGKSTTTMDKRRGIYIDFIYNPNYYLELSIVKYMLIEILQHNPNMGYFYDYESNPTSTIVSVGYEHFGYRFRHRTVLLLKPKLLKDILYNDDIFKRTYVFLMTFFRFQSGNDPTTVPEYDRNVNFKRYRKLFETTLLRIDESNKDKIICRNDELYWKYEGRMCIEADTEYMKIVPFKRNATREFWSTTLNKIAVFMRQLLNETIQANVLTAKSDSCYKIHLRLEPNIRNVLLFSHKAVKTHERNEEISFTSANVEQQTLQTIILFKHRILHSLGVGHKYAKPSIMRFYNEDFQRNNAFFLMPEDYKSLSMCYGSRKERANPIPYIAAATNNDGETIVNDIEMIDSIRKINKQRYIRYYTNDTITRTYLNDFINDFAVFYSKYINHT